jgi:IS30 family transposase
MHIYIQKLITRGFVFVRDAIIKRLKKCGFRIRTITFDNDMVFSNRLMVSKALNADSFFSRTYTSEDKVTVENRIRNIRRFIFKNTDFSTVTDEQVKRFENYFNNRPIIKFIYITP